MMVGTAPPRVFYLCPDYIEPSWGIGMLYAHVAILRRHGIAAWVLHHQAPFRPAWLTSAAPIAYLDRVEPAPTTRDVLVVPEVLAGSGPARGFPGRRVVFVQNVFSIVSGLGGAADYQALGYGRAIAVLPHVKRVVERYFGLDATVVPPCIAAGFFADSADPGGEVRERRILLAPAKVMTPDREALVMLLQRRLAARPDWSLVELRGFDHGEVARLMRSSAFLVNVNLGEAFNTTVPEAMAAGCIVHCYEAFGGQDFLRDGVNANVFPNLYVFPLLDRLFDLMENYDARRDEIATMRHNALATAATFTEAGTEAALLPVIGALIA